MKSIDATLEAAMIEWRHELHRYPEFGFKEIRSADLVAEQLGGFGLEVMRNMGQTGVVGVLKKVTVNAVSA